MTVLRITDSQTCITPQHIRVAPLAKPHVQVAAVETLGVTPGQGSGRSVCLIHLSSRRIGISHINHGQPRLERRTVASRMAAQNVAARVNPQPLRRREMLEALAQQMLRKIDALRAAYLAYRAHFEGTSTEMVRHLNDAGGSGDNAGMTNE